MYKKLSATTFPKAQGVRGLLGVRGPLGETYNEKDLENIQFVRELPIECVRVSTLNEFNTFVLIYCWDNDTHYKIFKNNSEEN